MAVQLYSRDVGSGTPLVLLHAFPLSSAMWLAQREELRNRFRVITPDLRGFGGSPLGTDAPSVEVMADDVARLLQAKGIDRATVCGLSLGARVAMALRRRHPDRVLGLVLCGTTAGADSPEVRDRWSRQADLMERDGTIKVLLDDLLPRLVGPTTLRQRALLYGRVRGLVQSAPVPAVVWALRAMAGAPGAPEAFDAVAETRLPVLVVVGAEDELVGEERARALADALPDAELMVIPRCGHLAPVEQADLFNQSVAEFASALARTGRHN